MKLTTPQAWETLARYFASIKTHRQSHLAAGLCLQIARLYYAGYITQAQRWSMKAVIAKVLALAPEGRRTWLFYGDCLDNAPKRSAWAWRQARRRK